MRVAEPLRDQAQTVLDRTHARALASGATPLTSAEVSGRVTAVMVKRQGDGRLLLTCSLAAAADPSLDILRPFIKVHDRSFHGRAVDEDLVASFLRQERLPAMVSTVFTNRGLDRGDGILSQSGTTLLYRPAVELLEQVANGNLTAEDLLAEAIRVLLAMKRKDDAEMASLQEAARQTRTTLTSAEILSLLAEHKNAPATSRLPVLALAAAYEAAGPEAGWKVRPLRGHYAADRSTGALGDIEVVSPDDDSLINVLDGKDKVVTSADLADASRKAAAGNVPSYIVATTEEIPKEIEQAAAALSGSRDIAVRDWLALVRDILLLHPKARERFLDIYRDLVLDDPQVGQPLRESLLRLLI